MPTFSFVTNIPIEITLPIILVDSDGNVKLADITGAIEDYYIMLADIITAYDVPDDEKLLYKYLIIAKKSTRVEKINFKIDRHKILEFPENRDGFSVRSRLAINYKDWDDLYNYLVAKIELPLNMESLQLALNSSDNDIINQFAKEMNYRTAIRKSIIQNSQIT
jgi:hypothetical protein